ncbi:MAG: class I SAM-dependent methyltransferase [Acidobacteria bacterium]|nr:class I SAM-dependent methyltransferase [Acidobacteriota bacterium]
MQCPRCEFDTSKLDIYQILELPESHPERKLWQQNPEHRKTLEFYGWFTEPFENARLLVFGSGPASLAVPLSRLTNVSQVICFDRDEEARRSLEDIKVSEGLGKIQITGEGYPWKIPFEDDSFDVIICRYSMHHFEDQQGVIREIYRCLTWDGVLLYSDHSMPEQTRDTTEDFMANKEGTFKGYRTYHEMTELLTRNAFEILAIRPYEYRRGIFEDYVSIADPGLKEPLLRGGLGLDAMTKQQIKWSGDCDGPLVSYPIFDIAARRADEATALCI